MLPAFGGPESKAFFPLFKSCAESVGTEVTRYSLNTHEQRYFSQMSNKWMDIISNSKEQSAVLDVSPWLSRAAMDAIGEGKVYAGTHLPFFSLPSAGFDIHFGCIDSNENALGRAYSNLLSVLTFSEHP